MNHSVFSCSDKGVVVGYAAAEQAEKNSKNTIYDAKRFIGKHFAKDELAAEASRYAFEVSQN
jgi:stress 70 chaperone-associated protein